MKESLEPLFTALRMSEVSRWSILGVLRPQSVSEHTFRVMLIATNIHDWAVDGMNHNSFDRELLVNACLMHDVPETATGDLPSPFKKALEAVAPGAYDKAALLCAQANPQIMVDPDMLQLARRTAAAIQGTWLYPILKSADILEAIIYLREWGRPWDARTNGVLATLENKVENVVNPGDVKMAQRYTGAPGDPDTTWHRIQQRVYQVLTARVQVPRGPHSEAAPERLPRDQVRTPPIYTGSGRAHEDGTQDGQSDIPREYI